MRVSQPALRSGRTTPARKGMRSMPELGSSTRTPARPRGGGSGHLAAAAATATAGAAVLAAVMLAPHGPAPALKLSSAQSALSVPGRGATVPFTEYEADDAATNGT